MQALQHFTRRSQQRAKENPPSERKTCQGGDEG